VNLTTTYQGGRDPFEGDLRLLLHSLPDGASVTLASVSIEPSKAPLSPSLFREVFAFQEPQDPELLARDWGIERNPASGKSVEVNFHARRTLAGVAGSGTGTTLQVDMGGVLVSIAEDGTFWGPGGKDEMIVDLSNSLTGLPGLTVNRFALRAPAEGGLVSVGKVEIRSVPTNVTLRLDRMPPFWTYVGEMAKPQKSNDFAAVLNAFLVDAPVEDGFYIIPLIVHSDAMARLDIAISIDFVIIRPIMPSYLSEATLSYGYSSLPGVNEGLMTVVLPRGVLPVPGTGATLSGTFDASRVLFGAVGDQETTGTVNVSPGRTLAQSVQMEDETPATGIDLPLANTAPGLAGLNLAIQEDADGKPSGNVLQSSGISVEKPIPGRSSWGSAKLPSEFRFLKGVRYWLIIQSISGEAYWDVEKESTGALPLQSSVDGGFSWRVASTSQGDKPLQGIFRLRYSPERFSVPVQLQIGQDEDSARVGFNKFSPLGRVQFNVDFSSELGAYLESTSGESLCGKGDLLINGDFELPHIDDATRKIFGFDEGRSTGNIEVRASVVGQVDLSRGLNLGIERFITLSVDGKSPLRIDCRGAVPERTGPDEIASAINNAAAGEAEASLLVTNQNKNVLRIESLTEGESSSVRLHCWCRNGPPDGWQGGAGVVSVKGPVGVAAALVALPSALIAEIDLFCHDGSCFGMDSGSPVVLRQSFKAREGCTYILRFILVAIELKGTQRIGLMQERQCLLSSTLMFEGTESPSWEVIWQDGSGKTIEARSEIIPPPGDAVPIGLWQYLYEARLEAPSGAENAEVHFVQPQAGILVIDEVSIVPTSSALSNGSFILWTSGMGDKPSPLAPVGWEYRGRIDRVIASSGNVLPGAVLSGDEDASLVQRAQVRPEESYTLKVRSQAAPFAQDGDLRPIEMHPRIEMQWMKGGLPVGEGALLVLDERGFRDRSWSGTAPAGSESAEIRITFPAGPGSLQVDSVSFDRSEMVSVPLTFLSEAPGELKVSGLMVAYDLPQPTRPEVTFVDTATVQSQPMPEASISRLSDRSAAILLGVSNRFKTSLSRASVPIETIGDLVSSDILAIVDAGVPRNRALEIKAAAEVALESASLSDSFSALSKMPLETILDVKADDLARSMDLPQEQVRQLQKAMRALRLTLKNNAFGDLFLSDLLSS
jgi:hypothetical protein